MDPQADCARTCSELLGGRARPGTGHEALQRAAVLAYFAGRELLARGFARELDVLRDGTARTGRPALTGAAAAILRAWRGRGAG